MRLHVPEVFQVLWPPATYKGAFGGRGSGKSTNFAQMAVVKSMSQPGSRGLCVREVQKTLKDSAKRLIEDQIEKLGAKGFQPLATEIRTPGGGVINFAGMQDHTAESMKSFEGLDWVWVEEAQTLSARSLQILRPTLRKDTSELWCSWNPRRKSDSVDQFFRGPNPMPGAVCVKANWSDNPFFTAKLEADRRHDLEFSPSYRHVWEGDYATVVEGTYFAADLERARQAGRITGLAVDPLLELRAFWDLGVEDAMAIWIAQFNGRRIDVLDYMEGQGQALGYYVNWLRASGYERALCFLPHDGARRGLGDALSFSQHLKDADFRTKVIPNQGKGAAMLRVEALRRLFPRMWFDGEKCAAGLEALGAYHERRDERRLIGLGPEHDWSSHGADAMGLLAITYEQPKTSLAPESTRNLMSVGSGSGGTGWLLG